MKNQARYKATSPHSRRTPRLPEEIAWPLLTMIVLVSAVAGMMLIGKRGIDEESIGTLVGLCVTYLGVHYTKRTIRRRKAKSKRSS